MIFDVWASILSLVARVWWKVGLKLDAWPFLVFRLIADQFPDLKREAAQKWQDACDNCLGKTFSQLHSRMPAAANCSSAEFRAIVEELAAQVD
eukprot:4623400-Pyramimonas_sp.AAC.1